MPVAPLHFAMTTPGDASMATREEVERVVRGDSGRVVR